MVSAEVDDIRMVFWWMLLTLSWNKVSAQGPVLTMMSGEQCFGSRVVLLCTHPDPFDDPDKYVQIHIAWAENGTMIDFSGQANARFTPTRLNSTASTLSFDITEEDHRDRVILYTCFLVRNNANRDRDESEALELDPPEKPYSPNITSLPSSSSNMTKWTHDSSCYSQCTFGFILTWTNMVDPPDSSSSGSNTTNDTQYDFSNLPRGEYSVSIQAQCMENTSIVSDVTSTRISLTAPVSSPGTTTTPSPTDPPGNQIIIIITVVVVVVVLIAIAILTTVGFICVCVQSNCSSCHEGGGVSPNPSRDNSNGRGGVSPNLSRDNSNGTGGVSSNPSSNNPDKRITYAELEHAQGRPVAAPSQKNGEDTQAIQRITYAELEHAQGRPVAAPSQKNGEDTQAIQVGKCPPPVPTPHKGSSEKDDKELEFGRQDSYKSDEFKTHVVTIFQKVKIVHAPVTSGQNVLGNYKKTSFVANVVYVEDESQDVSDRDIERVAIAKSRHRTDKGLLISNTGSIPTSLMEKLEKNGCYFIGLRTSDKEEVTEEMLIKKLDLVFT